MRHEMRAALLHVLEEKQAEKEGGHQRSSTQGEKLPKERRKPQQLLYLSLFLSQYKQRQRAWRCTAVLGTGASRDTQPAEPVWGHWHTSEDHPAAVTRHQGTDSPWPSSCEHTQEESSQCLLHMEPQLEPPTGQYGQPPADFWNCKVHFHEHNLLLLSKSCLLKWVPGYQVPTCTVKSTGIFLSRPHSRSTSRSNGKWDTLPASRLTALSALPHDRPGPGAGFHQGEEQGSASCFVSLQNILIGRAMCWGYKHGTPATDFTSNLRQVTHCLCVFFLLLWGTWLFPLLLM